MKGQRRISTSNLFNAEDRDFLELFNKFVLPQSIIKELRAESIDNADASDTDDDGLHSIPLQKQIEVVRTCLVAVYCQGTLDLQLFYHLITLL